MKITKTAVVSVVGRPNVGKSTLTSSVKSPPAARRCIGETIHPLLRVKKTGFCLPLKL